MDPLTWRKQLAQVVIDKAMKDRQFRNRLIENPRETVAQELGGAIPNTVNVRVVEEDPHTVYLMLPFIPPAMEGDELTDAELEMVAGGADVWTCNSDCGSCGDTCPWP